MPTVLNPQGLCRFGLARCDITPPVGIYHRMWGAATHDRSTGVHRPLTATALVFQNAAHPAGADNQQILIAVDHCLLWATEMSQVLDAVSRFNHVPREQIAVVFSHTHAAGLMGLERAGLPGGDLIPPYLGILEDRLAIIVRNALANAQLANITYGTGRCDLAAQRDFWDEESKQFVCGFNPGAAADDTVLVARITDAEGLCLATLVNYACHPTTLAWQNTQISPDFPGAMREVVEGATGAPCVFLQGASGDLGPREGFVGDVAVADRNGRQLGHAALSALTALPPPNTRFSYTGPVISGATLGSWQHMPLGEEERSKLMEWQLCRWTVDLPYRDDLPNREQTRQELTEWEARERAALAAKDAAAARDCRAMVERMTRRLTRIQDLPAGPTFPFPVTLLRIGGGLLLAVEAELYQWFQQTLRQRFPHSPIVVMTLTNGSRVSYLPTQATYGKGIYQESIAVLAPGCLERLLEAVCAGMES